MLVWCAVVAVASEAGNGAPALGIERVLREHAAVAAREDIWRAEQLESLRRRISESRATLDVLRDIYPEAGLGPVSVLSVDPTDQLGGRYDLVGWRILVDGALVHEGTGSWEGEVRTGVRRVELRGRVRGQSRSVFTYLSGYELELHSAQDIEVRSGQRTVARPAAVARPGFGYRYSERPAWWWSVEPVALPNNP